MNLFLLAGTIQPNMAPYIKDAAQMMFAQQHGVTWLRIQNVGLVYDDAYIYISYTLLDKAPPIGIYNTFIWDVSGEKGSLNFRLNKSFSAHVWPLSKALALWLKFPLGLTLT